MSETFDASELLREAELAHPRSIAKQAYYIAARLVDRSGRLQPAEEVNDLFMRTEQMIFELMAQK